MHFGDMASLAALIFMIWTSLRAGRRLPDHARIPMQWGLDGKPTWTAPRAVGLWFTPVLGGLILGFVAALLWLGAPTTDATRPDAAVFVQLLVAASLAGAHFLHLRHVLRRAI